ncbi:MAG TPA: CDF family Co(II)/Ni(II) efflux transporter DmeF [Stellaceae bacterium]|nr:CDF family Co(II)/Ni(II) efflux transporter DmeF [Stellaceae bacterium]
MRTTPTHDDTMRTHGHSHVFLGADHARNERKTWGVIALCSAMMILEIGGGALFGSMALIADGLHMSTHATALGIAALAYTYARRRAEDPRFTFGTGKFGDLAGYTGAIILAMIALLIGYEAVSRLFAPIHIDFDQAIPIAVLGLLVNIASAWMLSGGHSHGHAHGPGPGHTHGHDDHDHGHHHGHGHGHEHGNPHHDDAAEWDNNMRAAFLHVAADGAVSVLAIVGLSMGKFFGWVWMDPVMGIVGALVIANWSHGLVRDTGSILLDMTTDGAVAGRIRRAIETDGDGVADLHLWRLGPGHLGAILSVVTSEPRSAEFYHALLGEVGRFSHVTVEVRNRTVAETQ